MKSYHYLVVYVALCAIWITASEAGPGRGRGNKKFMELFKKCGDGEINTEEAMKGRDTCMAEVNPTTPTSRRRRAADDDDEDQSNGGRNGKRRGGRGNGRGGGGRGRGMRKKALCVMVCQWKIAGLIDDKGKYSDSGADAYVKRIYPEKYQGKMIENLKACASESSSNFSMDGNCSGYRPFKRCVMKSHIDACEIQLGMGKGGKKGGKSKPAPEPADSDEDEGALT